MRVVIVAYGIAAGLSVFPAGVWAGDAPLFTWQGIDFMPYAGVLSGYSTNPDEFAGGEDSAFTQYDAGLKAAMQTGNSKFKAEVNGTILDYYDLDKSFRWLYEVKASGKTQVSKSDLLEYDVRRRRDALDDNYDELTHRVRAAWTHTAKVAEVKLGTSFRNKDFLAPDTHNEFDYVMPGAELTMRFMPETKVSPFIVLSGADVNYLNQVESIVDRDAKNYSVTGGLRWQPAKTIALDVGGRYNLRLLEDHAYSRVENGFADLQLHWTPSNKLDVKAAVWRELAEPYKSSGVVADQINYELGFVLTPADRWRFEGKGTFQWEHEIGADVNSTDTEITAAGYYEISSSVRTFVKGRQLWESDRSTVDHSVVRSATTEIMVGIETTF